MADPAPPVRILICEDSRTYAAALRGYLEHDGDLNVVGVCATGEQLLDAVPRLHPDLITMDLELPGLDGLSTTQRVMASQPCPILVISSHTRRGSERAAAALASGALEAIPKSEIRLDRADGVAATALRRRIRRLSRVRVPRNTPLGRTGVAPRGGSRAVAERRPDVGEGAGDTGGSSWPAAHLTAVIAIAASTGGPRALHTVLGGLPPHFPIPVVVVQHMAPGFIEGLARWLDGLIDVEVGVARQGQVVKRGVWFAPDGDHMLVEADRSIRLDPDAGTGRHRPSGDALLESMAASFGRRAVGVVLTGMGRDGALGAGAIVRAGGLVIAEHPSTAVVNGMPAAAAAQGAQRVVAVDQVAGLLTRLRPAG